MHVLVNGVRLFFDVEGAKLAPDGPAMPPGSRGPAAMTARRSSTSTIAPTAAARTALGQA